MSSRWHLEQSLVTSAMTARLQADPVLQRADGEWAERATGRLQVQGVAETGELFLGCRGLSTPILEKELTASKHVREKTLSRGNSPGKGVQPGQEQGPFLTHGSRGKRGGKLKLCSEAGEGLYGTVSEQHEAPPKLEPVGHPSSKAAGLFPAGLRCLG